MMHQRLPKVLPVCDVSLRSEAGRVIGNTKGLRFDPVGRFPGRGNKLKVRSSAYISALADLRMATVSNEVSWSGRPDDVEGNAMCAQAVASGGSVSQIRMIDPPVVGPIGT